MANLKDVAKIAGVTPTTVSRVINMRGSLSQETIDKVHRAMQELHYQPNALARSLQGKRSKLIGLIFPSVSYPFYGEIIHAIESKLFTRGYKAILCDSENDPVKERDYLTMLMANQVDGIITSSHNKEIHEYEHDNLAIVAFDRYLAEGIPIVSSDNFAGGQLAVAHLYELGCRKIAMIAGSYDTKSPTHNRLLGYQQKLSDLNLSPLVHYLTKNSTLEGKRQTILKFLSETETDGIFCTDDLTALMVKDIASELNLKQIQVIGYDGTQLIQNYLPSLATIVQPIDALAELMVTLLIEEIENKAFIPEKRYTLPVTLKKSQ
ncbi:MAG: LacI family DNA-binding transcriptional regulator [Streptococcaceae bacterium]|jgi:LacI family sucrose operon transcriptional repressor|nr:LacI family DNA-binding transcriptional regulator [Streptococcaceae bacterium]